MYSLKVVPMCPMIKSCPIHSLLRKSRLNASAPFYPAFRFTPLDPSTSPLSRSTWRGEQSLAPGPSGAQRELGRGHQDQEYFGYGRVVSQVKYTRPNIRSISGSVPYTDRMCRLRFGPYLCTYRQKIARSTVTIVGIGSGSTQ